MKTDKEYHSDSSGTKVPHDNSDNLAANTVATAEPAAGQDGWPTQLSAPGSGLVPQSPAAAGVIRQVDYPVTPSLGLADVTIPLYTVRAGDVEVPIYISYRSSGMKVDEIAGSVGLGWTLHAGGSVVREVRGKMDEGLKGYSSGIPPIEPSVGSLASYISKEEDAYRDKYYYSYPGGCGSFIMGRYDPDTRRGSIENKHKTCFNDDRIEFEGAYDPWVQRGPERIEWFRITDPYGRRYEFLDRDMMKFYNFLSYTFRGKRHSGLLLDSVKEVISGWNLNSIVSSDGKSKVEFSYQRLGKVARESLLNEKTYKKLWSADNDAGRFDASLQASGYNTGISYMSKGIKTISFSGNTVNFHYTDSAVADSDFSAVMSEEVYDPNPVRRLAEITVVNCNGELIKRIVFRNREGEPSIRRYKLNALEFYDADGKLYDKHEFTYYDTRREDGYVISADFQPPAYAQDHFGYYNGQDSNTNLHFFTLYDNETDLSRNRRYSFAYARHQSLRSIKRLWGSVMEFVYEPNTHVHPTLGEISIGLRVKEVKVSDPDRCVKSTRFGYEQSGTTIDFTKLDLSAFLERKQYELPPPEGTETDGNAVSPEGTETDGEKPRGEVYECLVCSPHSLLPGAAMENAVVFYGKVTEDVTDLLTGNVLRTEYVYDTADWTHTYVEQQYYNKPRTPEDQYKYIAIQDYVNSNPARPSDGKERYVGEIRGYFKEKTITFDELVALRKYECLGGGGFRPVEEQLHTYTKYNAKEMYEGLYVKNMVTWPSTDVPDGYYEKKWIYVQLVDGKTVTTEHDNYMVTRGDCYFFPIHEDVFLTKRTQTRIKKYYDGEVKEQPILYNYNVSSTPLYNWPCEEIYNVNPDPHGTLSSYQLKKTTTRIDSDLYMTRYLYSADYSGVFSHLSSANMIYRCVGKETFKNSARISSEYTNYKYLKRTDDEGKEYAVYVPVKTIRCLRDTVTEQTDILDYDSYCNPVCIASTGAPCTCYVWSYRWMYPVAEIRGAGYEELKSALGGDSVIESIGNATSHTQFIGKLNALRRSLPEALITTFTYKPLVGVTSVTDPAGRVVTYHYDGAGRLNAVKDENGNLLETYEYGKNN